MQNVHGKEMDLLRVTVKVPGKRPPRAVAPAGPSPAPTGVNGLAAADGAGAGAGPVRCCDVDPSPDLTELWGNVSGGRLV